MNSLKTFFTLGAVVAFMSATAARAAQQTVGLGSTADDGTGDTLRIAFDKVNDNFVELYALPWTTIVPATGVGTVLAIAPNATGGMVTTNGTATLTNKTLTGPVMTAPVLGTIASGNGAALTGVIAATGDSATSFFSTGTLEDALIASTLTRDGEAITGSVAAGTFDASGFNGNLATTDNTVQEIAQKLDDLASISGAVATDTIFDAAGDIVQGTGANTSARLPIGTAGQLLKVNAGATALEYTSSPSVSSLTVSGAVTAGSIAYNGALAADDTAGAITLTGLTAGATIAQWEAVYIGGSSTYLLADANGSGTYPARGLAAAAYSSTNAATIVTSGTVRNDAWAWTPGGTIYLSATAGALTQTIPATTGDKIQVMGYALTADIMMVAIGTDYGTSP